MYILISETSNEAEAYMEDDIKVKITYKNGVWDYEWNSYDTKECPVVCFVNILNNLCTRIS